MSLSTAERKLAASIGFEETVLELLKKRTQSELSQAIGMGNDYEFAPAAAVAASASRSEVVAMVADLQPKLLGLGYRPFWSEQREANGAHSGEVVVVLKTTDQFAILDLWKTNGVNYGVEPEDVVHKLKDWESRFTIQIVGAAESWAAVQFSELPRNIGALAEEIYEFCPDSVEQGFGLMREQDHPAEFAAAQIFFPELSERMQEKLANQKKEFEALELPPEMRNLLASSAGLSTSTEMGIRLLAYHLNRDREIFLWWD